eukprot:TRINITY_DN89553_c0_g1_i1.p1 TRINITY_DN89553_c0_g1~~TRINITY_DN89553_c0_g1_i1.p1  ORF type:complete len:254 (-),score=55.23 TRINITY_DN89553_c0_g1_i1:59-778(-)
MGNSALSSLPCCATSGLDDGSVAAVVAESSAGPKSPVSFSQTVQSHETGKHAALPTRAQSDSGPQEILKRSGSSGKKKLTKQLTMDLTALQTKVKTFKVKIEREIGTKREKKLGLDIDYAEENQALLVIDINGGCVADWNNNNPGCELRSGDAIVAVNGISGDVDKMLKACCLSPKIELLVVEGTANMIAIDPTASGLMAARAYFNAEAKKEGDSGTLSSSSAQFLKQAAGTLTWSIRG